MERSSQVLLGGGLALVGLLGTVLPWIVRRSQRADAQEARAQQSWTTGMCQVQRSEQVTVGGGENRQQTLRVHFTVRAGGRAYPDIEYTYPYYWNAALAAHAPGASVPCYYDPANPARAALVRRAAPTGDGTDSAVPYVGITLFGGMFLALGLWIVTRREPLRVGGGDD
jgi:hypothetical protein